MASDRRGVVSWRQRGWTSLGGGWLLCCCIALGILSAQAEPVLTNANTLLLTDDDADQMPGAGTTITVVLPLHKA